MKCCILTLFPEMFPGALGHSLAKASETKGLWSWQAINIRDFATDKHHTVDDTPYGGGAGMVLKANIVARAIDAAYEMLPDARLIYMTPRGQPLNQTIIRSLSITEHDTAPPSFIFLCGRFEGIDERVIEAYRPLELSIGDYILFGGELAAQVVIEALLRYVPGVLGNDHTTHEETFTIGEESACLLEYPHYTKPPLWRGKSVPEVLLSGHHRRIKDWRRDCSESLTRTRRPDLWDAYISKKTPES